VKYCDVLHGTKGLEVDERSLFQDVRPCFSDNTDFFFANTSHIVQDNMLQITNLFIVTKHNRTGSPSVEEFSPMPSWHGLKGEVSKNLLHSPSVSSFCCKGTARLTFGMAMTKSSSLLKSARLPLFSRFAAYYVFRALLWWFEDTLPQLQTASI
jgi:hypothetical protein